MWTNLMACIRINVGVQTGSCDIPTFYRPQRSCGQGYVFTRVCDSVNGGRGVSGEGGTPPPQTRQTPPCGPGRPPTWTRQTPRDQADTPPNQADPPDQADTPWTRQTPPPPPQTLEADFRIRSTSGRYASYWNAFLFHHVNTFC